jgi:hypothetical protein
MLGGTFRAIFCFINPDYHLIRMTSSPLLIRISEGLLYLYHYRIRTHNPSWTQEKPETTFYTVECIVFAPVFVLGAHMISHFVSLNMLLLSSSMFCL